MFSFNSAAVSLTGLVVTMTGEPITVTSADGSTATATRAVIDYDVTLETQAGQVLRGQTVAAFAKTQLAGVRIEGGVTVQAATKNYRVRNIQDEDEWLVVAVLVPVSV